jgi:hypothetical protein
MLIERLWSLASLRWKRKPGGTLAGGRCNGCAMLTLPKCRARGLETHSLSVRRLKMLIMGMQVEKIGKDQLPKQRAKLQWIHLDNVCNLGSGSKILAVTRSQVEAASSMIVAIQCRSA